MIYRFGHFEIDASARELRAGGRHVETEPKAFDLLVYLVSNRDRAVPKDELLNTLWPRQIVTETALTRAVMKARRAVGDDSGRQAVIRTIHGHGYRFVAELAAEPVPVEAPQASSAGSDEHEAPAPGPRRRWRVMLAVLVAAVIVAGASLLALREDAPAVAPASLAVLPVANGVADAELDWVRLGLMSLMQRMFDENGVSAVEDSAVMAAVGDDRLDAPPGPDRFAVLKSRAGADSLLHTRLEREGGLYRLAATLLHPDGRKTRRVIVGESPAALAAQMAGVMSRLMTGTDFRRGGRFARYSTDPFVNEMYARALDLELQGQLEEARRLFRLAAEQEPELFWLRYEIALCTRDLREWDEAERQFEALYREARDGTDARAMVVTLNSHGIMHYNRNEFEEAEALFLEAWEAARDTGLHSDRATVFINLALVAATRDELDRAASLYDEALAALDAAGEAPPPTFLNNYAGLLLRSGDLARARDYSERAVEGFRIMGNRRFEAPSLNRLARILRRQGDLEGAEQRHEQALAIYRELGNDIGELSVMAALTSLYRMRGDLSRAEANATEVLERAKLTGDEILLGDAEMQMAYTAMDLGRFDEARRRFEEARVIFAGTGDEQGTRAADTGIASAAIRAGQTTLAARIAQSLLETAEAAGNDAATARAQLLNGRVARAEGDLQIAAAHYRTALGFARASGDAVLLPEVAMALADLELEQGNAVEAARLAEEVRTIVPADHEFLRLDARLAIARGDADRAREVLETLRRSAGEAWSAEDEALLAEVRR